MAIDWDAVEENNGAKFKNYATPGIYKVKCVDVEIKEVGSNGAIAQEFLFEEDENNKYPKATHWLTFKEGKDGWRQWHNLNIMMMFGLEKETAKKTIEQIESSNDKAKIVKGYETAYKKLLKNNPAVEIEVFPDGKYCRAEFTNNNVAMPHDKKLENAIVDDALDGAVDLSIDDLPFNFEP